MLVPLFCGMGLFLNQFVAAERYKGFHHNSLTIANKPPKQMNTLQERHCPTPLRENTRSAWGQRSISIDKAPRFKK